MKTYKHLYTNIIAFENLYWAYRKARKGKRDQEKIADFEFNSADKNFPWGGMGFLPETQWNTFRCRGGTT
jgi:hypothetical protein